MLSWRHSVMNKFWQWYEKTYTLNISIALGLFLLQIVHLIWLFGQVIWTKAFGTPLFELTGFWQWLIIVVDYTEIPALISVGLIYVNELRTRYSNLSAFYLAALSIQWVHLFWITDEFVVSSFAGVPSHIPAWLAWIAILIDYLEVPVMLDTFRRFLKALKERRLEKFLKTELREH